MSATLTTVAGALGPLLDPFDGEIMRRALLEVLLLGTAGGLLGTWIVANRLTFTGEALPHAMFPGLVGAALLGVPLVVGGAVGLLVAAVLIALASRIETIDRDTAVAVVFTSLFGLGVLLALSPDSPAAVRALLFGDVLGLTDGDLLVAAGLTTVVAVALWTLHPRLTATAFDRSAARSFGVRPGTVDLALVALIAVATLVCVQALGNLFVAATLVGPAAAAHALGRRVAATMAIAVALAVLSGVGGLLLSFHAGTAAGASIALVTVATYLVVVLVARVPFRRPTGHPVGR
ncbi:MAG: metal ABC transporter permease [Solirubrobacteraceae bacterium]|nr:metal ABC transporter permease [Solirubrobacteraceae bacterium]